MPTASDGPGTVIAMNRYCGCSPAARRVAPRGKPSSMARTPAFGNNPRPDACRSRTGSTLVSSAGANPVCVLTLISFVRICFISYSNSCFLLLPEGMFLGRLTHSKGHTRFCGKGGRLFSRITKREHISRTQGLVDFTLPENELLSC